MKLKGKIPLIIIAGLAWVVVISSCANIGMPAGGPKDSIPPVLLETNPDFKALNFKGKDVRFTFDEYILPDEISESLVISPPLKKRPIIRTKSKTLIILFNEELKDSTTYSLDFKNSIVDNNEKNPMENLRFSFSTGPVYDSLRVAGRVVNAVDLEPIEKGLVLMQSNLHDSAVFKVIPDYIAKTDEDGLFMIDNIAPGSYHVFALNDQNNNMLYDEGAEEIAFYSEVVVPRAEFHENKDTIANAVDSLLIMGHTHFFPEPIYLSYFMEDIFEQYIDKSERTSEYKCSFVFNESVEDTFDIRLLDHQVSDWYLMEYNQEMDSIVLWITDTTLAKEDSLYMELSYFMLDSMAQPYVFHDTLLMQYSKPVVDTKKKKKKGEEEEGPARIPQFSWSTSLGPTMELDGIIKIESPTPIALFDSTQVILYLNEDTLKTPLNIKFEKDSKAWRTYNISYDWEPQTSYTLRIDSAACWNVFGVSSMALEKGFQTREEDYYGSFIFDFSNVPGPMIVQLLKNSKEEEVLRQKFFDKDGEVEFDLVPPEKYKIKIIYDTNGNGKWDGGSYQDKIQPELVSYLPELIKLRSNWTEKRIWDVTPNPEFVKKIIDQEAEEQKRKAEQEKARKEKENEKKNNNFNTGGGSNLMRGGGF
ncbi:Ig-like domain-containing domain [Maribellus sp. YY47]|uniref:Ig-like domain-containing domain n=1 Tax=Maribellus sp. YY47 TaxID=2929486 RepID=UPI0020011871|nr:Ig-like domain-containing domain [Maribellus sp. YY47]MCK3683634.1 Ig-like domain-containing domain [Maribellus sp. YY47]